MTDDPQRYSQDEVNAILRRALEEHDVSAGLSHDDLVDAAREVGIDHSALERAVAEVKREREALVLREQWRNEQKQALTRAAFNWAWVNVLVGVIDFVTPGGPWFFWVLIATTLMLVRRALTFLGGPTPGQLEGIERRRLRTERHRELQQRFEKGANLLGTAVEQGAQFLIDQLAEKRRLSNGSSEPPKPPTSSSPGKRG